MKVEALQQQRSWLPPLPGDWRVAHAKTLFTERRQLSMPDDIHLTPSQAYGVLPQDEYMRVTGGRVVLNLEGADRMKHVEPGDFISHLRSFQGGLELSLLRGKVSAAYTVLTPRPGVIAEYFRWAMKSAGFIQELRTTSNQLRDGQSIRLSNIAMVPLPLPPAPEQRAIADFLDRETAQIDTLIAKQEELITRLRERRAALIERSGLRGYDPFDPIRSKGGIPIGARFSVTLGKMLDAGKDRREHDEELPYIRAANLQDGGLRLHDVNRMPFSLEEATRLDLRAGDLLVTEGGAVGTSVLLQSDMPGWSFQKTVNRVRSRGNASTRWLGYVVRAYRDNGVIDLLCNASTIPHLTGEKLRALRVPVVEVAEQREVADELDAQTARIDDVISKSEQVITLAKERRAALITAAVTGQIDVTRAA